MADYRLKKIKEYQENQSLFVAPISSYSSVIVFSPSYRIDAEGNISLESPQRDGVYPANAGYERTKIPDGYYFYFEKQDYKRNPKEIFQMNGGHGYFVDHGKSVSLYYGESVTLFAAEKYNHPPNTPDSITLPSTIKGGSSCSISWSAATDPDGNLEGYIVERSYNGGSSWSQIYQGSATSTSTTIPHGTGTVMFRVCAYDTDGEKSGWRTSSNKTVLNNRAPSAPPSINVPVTPCGGETITITWSAASDPDGNLEGYHLERQWDGKGGFDQIYQGSGLSYTDTIPKGEHTSVTYRVRAYDSFGETSGYTTSPVRTVDNNLAPVIQCDLSGNLGDKSEGFVVPYTVTDTENHAVTVTERVGNLVKRTYSVTLGQSNSFQITGDYFQKILNGEQAAEIIATDTEGKSSTLSLTFTKKVHRASIMLSEPLTVENPITVCVIKVVGNIPEDAEFKVEVANNVGDDLPAWEDATDAAKRGINYVFKNKTQTGGWKFGFRVTAERGASDTAGYITSIQGGFQ